MKYSDKEQRLIYALRFEDFLNQEPAVTYRALALYCFSKNLQNYLADNVRRCYNALQEGTPYRLTKEFDDLIEFPPGRTTRERTMEKVILIMEQMDAEVVCGDVEPIVVSGDLGG